MNMENMTWELSKLFLLFRKNISHFNWLCLFSKLVYIDEVVFFLVDRRGRPQFLHRVRWDEIRKIWLNQSIPTHVARRQEIGSDVGGWPTF